MKKLSLDLSLEVRKAACNFCSEVSDQCVKGAKPLMSLEIKTEFQKVIEDYELVVPLNFFLKPYKKIHGYKLKEVVIDKKFVANDYSDICFNCINQLAKLIK